MTTPASTPSSHFIKAIIDKDLAQGKHAHIVTRFPPEPNGFLHIGHAKSICLNFGLAESYAGSHCNLRFDDSNPAKEEQTYIDAIIRDVTWLGFSFGNTPCHASDYFETLYNLAVELIQKNLAYVCELSAEDIRAYRGTLTEPGKESPFRNRSVEENLDLFARMRQGEFEEGTHVLRAKIDMNSPNMNMRDPVIYRIIKTPHPRTGTTWCIYPMYDFAHCISDALEGITHSLCTLEFADHKPLYDWILDHVSVPCHPVQIEFARLNINYTVTSKRKLHELVREGLVDGWDDPRMPTLSGMRRRGFPPEAIRAFCERIGVSRKDSCVDMGVLESCVRDALNDTAPRTMAVLKPLKIVLTDYPNDQEEYFELPVHPKNPAMGTRKVPFCREIYIEKDDFLENPPKKFFRLAPGREVRLRGAYLVTCTQVIRDTTTGAIKEIHCTHDPASRGGDAPDGRKVKGTLHWVSARHALDIEVRLYDRMFSVPFPTADKGKDFKEFINPESLRILTGCKADPALAQGRPEQGFQFERQGFFCRDSRDNDQGMPVYNRTVTIRDSWAKKK
ncbi:glutamine--tRNA ligase/YqeY domain fusion protein [Desulfoplanes formicivorans]|uniref:Glutamine--tRNA ligase n=1 Tax=Desulfoplanes formicivorans TaxID=1592317 RepID=A0A194ALR2_9BACT|nr:glutamine--tRNA ligase/YqeY domain fusion protein [Desulfoplanes formicivorans]GAU09599.1 glutaminyl-tRNA synthetase [Desulfoplanes formicivorans]